MLDLYLNKNKTHMSNTNYVNLNLLYPHQIHKEILINENTMIIDAMLSNGVRSMQVNILPNDAKIGDKYILVEEGKIAIRLEDIWHYTNAVDGMLCWVIDETKLVVYSQGMWKVLFSEQCSSAILK